MIDIGDRRFIPFIQLHEYEACLFTDVTQFKLFYPDSEMEIAALKKIADGVSTPELIDDGQHMPPRSGSSASYLTTKRRKKPWGHKLAS